MIVFYKLNVHAMMPEPKWYLNRKEKILIELNVT